jgi:hypothetical protein
VHCYAFQAPILIPLTLSAGTVPGGTLYTEVLLGPPHFKSGRPVQGMTHLELLMLTYLTAYSELHKQSVPFCNKFHTAYIKADQFTTRNFKMPTS